MSYNHVYFPTYPGLLTKEHREKIGTALWEFLWCIDKTTMEKEDSNEKWGIVLKGRPIKYQEIADDLGMAVRSVKDHMKILQDNGYIEMKRAPYGVIIRVKKSKKYIKRSAEKRLSGSEEKRTSAEEVQKNELPEVQKYVHRSAEKRLSNKDQSFTIIKDTITNYQKDESDLIAERYLTLRTIQEGREVYPNPKDYEAIARIVARGMPLPQTIKLLEDCFSEFEEREPEGRIKVFTYCEKYINDKWKRMKDAETAKQKAKEANKSASHSKNSQQHYRDEYEELSL
jgi:DNA-binding MarR family transcriptional regulator